MEPDVSVVRPLSKETFLSVGLVKLCSAISEASASIMSDSPQSRPAAAPFLITGKGEVIKQLQLSSRGSASQMLSLIYLIPSSLSNDEKGCVRLGYLCNHAGIPLLVVREVDDALLSKIVSQLRSVLTYNPSGSLVRSRCIGVSKSIIGFAPKAGPEWMSYMSAASCLIRVGPHIVSSSDKAVAANEIKRVLSEVRSTTPPPSNKTKKRKTDNAPKFFESLD